MSGRDSLSSPVAPSPPGSPALSWRSEWERRASLGLSHLPAPWLLLGLCVLGQVHMARQQVKDKIQRPQTCWGARPELTGLAHVPAPLTSVPAFTCTFQHYCPLQVAHCCLNRYTKHLLISGGPVAGTHCQSYP